MLRKIVEVKNVGRFLKYGANGDVELRRYNLFFAENGRGKTTLCAVLRSLQTGDPDRVAGRTTLGGAGSPAIDIRTDAGNAVFGKGAWNTTLPGLAIFDSTFVSENVYSGDFVSLDQRRNLFRVIIGKQGVDLARQIDRLDAEIRAQTSEIRDWRSAVELQSPRGVPVDSFLRLDHDPDIDTKIEAARKELEGVRQADLIRNHAALSLLAIPASPDGLEKLLASTVEGLSTEAEGRVSAHIEAHSMREHGEEWLSAGQEYVRDGTCPFCGQSVDGVDLVTAYGAYFSDAYQSLRGRLTSALAEIEAALSERAIAQAERVLESNDANIEFWTRFADIARPVLAAHGGVEEPLQALRKTAIALLVRKNAAPLDPIEPDETYTTALHAVGLLQQAAAVYNLAVQTANGVIAATKEATAAANISVAEARLRRGEAVKARHQPEARAACDSYEAAVEAKRGLEEQKVAVRRKLDEHTESVIGQYEKAINTVLEDFQAGFRIVGTKHDYRGGVPSSSFQILINETRVDLGDQEATLGAPSFRNTLSSGDKSALALAFFLVRVESDPDRANSIVVFDDPFHSQDAFRKDQTIAKIVKSGEGTSQVIVLSHDQSFLKRLWDRLGPSSDRRCLKMARVGLRNTAIVEWDIEKATQGRFKADLGALRDYYNAANGEPRDVVGRIRPVLEAYCRHVCASEFGEKDMLAYIIEKIRTAGATHRLAGVVEDLDSLNQYTKRYHHGESPSAATERVNDAELQGFVKKTLTITGYC